MDKIKDLITNSLFYLDTNYEKYIKLFKRFKFHKLEINDSDLDYNKINFYDENEKQIFKTRYEVIGIYTSSANIWTWGWSVPRLKKNMIYTIRKLLNYGLDLPPNQDEQFLKAELITSRFRITNEIQLEMHAAIASYVSKKPMIFKLIINPDIIPNPESDIQPLVDHISKNDIVYYLYLLDEDGLMDYRTSG